MDAIPLTDPRLQDALAYWRRKAAGRPMPLRADIDPVDIPHLLANVLLVEVRDGGRFRYRLVGTENVRAYGFDATGRYLDEILVGPEYKAHVLNLYTEVVRERRPLYSECLLLSPQQDIPERHIKVVFLPLSRDGEAVHLVLAVQVFFYLDQSTRERHLLDARRYRELVHVLL
jgi:hypothetical protein